MLIFVWSLVCQTSNKKNLEIFQLSRVSSKSYDNKSMYLSVQELFKSERKPVRDYNLYAM